MGSIIAAIISGVIALGTTIAKTVIDKKQRTRAQAEAKGLYQQQSADNMKQFKIDKRIADKQYQNNKYATVTAEQGFLADEKLRKDKTTYEVDKANQASLKKATDVGMPETVNQSYLFKSRINQRF